MATSAVTLTEAEKQEVLRLRGMRLSVLEIALALLEIRPYASNVDYDRTQQSMLDKVSLFLDSCPRTLWFISEDLQGPGDIQAHPPGTRYHSYNA